MGAYFARRLLLMIPTLLGITFVVFCVTRFVPGGPIEQAVMRMEMGGVVGHAEIQIGNSRVMLADEHPDMNVLAPKSAGSSGVGLCVYVENVDELVSQAIKAGATIERPLQDQFYGDRSATLVDPFNHRWTVATHIEDVTPEEMNRRMAAGTA